MSPHEAACAWAVLEAAPDLYPHVAWRIWSDPLDSGITIIAYRSAHKISFAFSYMEIADRYNPCEWLAGTLCRMVQDLGAVERIA